MRLVSNSVRDSVQFWKCKQYNCFAKQATNWIALSLKVDAWNSGCVQWAHDTHVIESCRISKIQQISHLPAYYMYCKVVQTNVFTNWACVTYISLGGRRATERCRDFIEEEIRKTHTLQFYTIREYCKHANGEHNHVVCRPLRQSEAQVVRGKPLRLSDRRPPQSRKHDRVSLLLTCRLLSHLERRQQREQTSHIIMPYIRKNSFSSHTAHSMLYWSGRLYFLGSYSLVILR